MGKVNRISADLAMKKPQSKDASVSQIIVDGEERLTAGVQQEARQIVEAKYADKLQAAGFIERWQLRRKMKAEIAKLADEMMPNVSSDAIF